MVQIKDDDLQLGRFADLSPPEGTLCNTPPGHELRGVLRLFAALLLAVGGCSADNPGHPRPGGGPDGGPLLDGGQPPPGPTRGRHAISALHVEPGGERVWVVHGAVADVDATPKVTTSHLGVYTPATRGFSDVLDTTGTLGKAILFPGNGRVLHVTRRGTDRDVFVLLDAAARRSLDQRSYLGDRGRFRLSPSGRRVLATDESDRRLHLLDTATLIDQPLPYIFTAIDFVEWAHTDDVLYVVQPEGAEAVVQRYDLRTADLAQPLPPPATVARMSGAPGPILILSLDHRFAAFEVRRPPFGENQIALVALATGNTRFVPGLFAKPFTNDHRAVIYDGFTKLRIVDPATGTTTQALTVPGVVAITALRRRDALMITPLTIRGPGFLYRIADGARTPLSRRVDTSMMYERPGHDELWEWFEFAETLSRFDLATGNAAVVATGVQNMDYRPEADDAILGRSGHWIQQLPLDPTRAPSPQTELPDPNDAPAPYRLDDR